MPSRPKQSAPAEPGLTHRALLPAGLNDGLPPDAAHEAAIVELLIASFAAHGYDRVKPPLVEFEETLLGGAGDVLRVTGAQISPERQFMQVGAELIGSAAAGADVEIVSLAASALRGLGIDSLSVDLIAPPLADVLIADLGFDRVVTRRLREALDRKDAAAVAELTSGRGGALFAGLMAATGSAARGGAALGALDLPAKAAAIRDRLVQVIDLLAEAVPDLPLTVDPVENRGFEYHTGVNFSIFARGVRGELGRGGRYVAGEADEPATGFTLYMDTMLRALPAPAPGRRLFMPAGAPAGEAERQRAQGWPVATALEPVADAAAEAKRLGCSHVWRAGAIEAVQEKTA